MVAGMCNGSHRYRVALWVVCASLALGACAIEPRLNATTQELKRQYQRAIGDAAVRHPDWNIPLWSFGDARIVVVSTLTDDPALDTVTQHNWVAATAEVRSLCQGKADSVLFLQKLLGLPPQAVPNGGKRWHVYTFEVSPEVMFRPCPGGVNLSSPSHPRCIAGTSLDSSLDDETARFLLHQYWYSHRAAIPGAGDVEFGYPWTGMGALTGEVKCQEVLLPRLAAGVGPRHSDKGGRAVESDGRVTERR
jgi:hypothetical protein